MTLSTDAYLSRIESDAATVAGLLSTADQEARVPACPKWDLADLGAHLGKVHRWARAALASTEPPAQHKAPGRSELVPWFVEGAAELVAALRAADPEQPCWSFSLEPSTSTFWVRRQAHETAVHRWDAQSATGEPEPVDVELAADGVAEVADLMRPRQVALGRSEPLLTPLGLRATDTDAFAVLGDGEPVAEVSGPASLLLLTLWRRCSAAELIDAGALTVTGDMALARSVLSERHTP